MLLAVIALWCLPRCPADAKFLSDKERKLQIERFTKGVLYFYILT